MLDFDRYSVLTFDCYGTLIDWESGILDSIKPVLARHGVVADDEAILEMYARLEAEREKGGYIRYRDVLRLAMTDMSHALGFDASRSELDCLSNSIPHWLPFPDTVASLQKLRTKYRLAIISNIDDSLFETTRRRLEVSFDWVITAQQAGAYKPSPVTFEHALRRIGRRREQILHIAQSVYHDIMPAKAMGLSTIWVNRRKAMAGSGATPPASGEPDLEVTGLKELAELIGM
jgi:2-haloacid dehalogenase